MADPTLGDQLLPAGVGGMIGMFVRELFQMVRSRRGEQAAARQTEAVARQTEVATDLSLAVGWKEYADRTEARIAKLESDRDVYIADRAAWLARERQLEAELSAARARIAQLEARVAELERASAEPRSGA